MAFLNRKTKRLIIRPFELTDYDVWVEHFETLGEKRNIWDISKKSKEELTKAKFKELLKDQNDLRKKDEFYDLGVFEKKSGKYIGRVSAMNVVRGLGHTCYIGYTLHHNFWRQGFAKEMVTALIDIIFRDLKLHRLEAGIEPNNRRSIMLARTLGLRKEGLKKRAVFLRNEWVDLVMYSATCEEFGFKWKGQTSNRAR